MLFGFPKYLLGLRGKKRPFNAIYTRRRSLLYLEGTMADFKNPNAFSYLGTVGNQSIQTLTDLPSMNATPLVFPPGLGRTDPSTTGNQTIPFTLFMPYKRATGVNALRSTVTGDTLFTEMPQPEFAIALPTPTSALKTQYGVEYSQFEVGGMVGGALASTNNLRDKVNEIVKNGWSDSGMIDSLKEASKNLTAGAGLNLAQALSSLVTSSETVPALFGVQENPYTEFIFKNVAPRNHSFSYTFMPRNKEESVLVDKIINIFKYTMLPRPTLGSLFFQFPYEFQIVHSTQSTTFTLLPSVLKSCEVDYSSGTDSPKFFKNSDYPAKITMTMEFQEVVLLNRDRIQKDAIITQDTGAPANALRFRF